LFPDTQLLYRHFSVGTVDLFIRIQLFSRHLVLANGHNFHK